MSPIRFYKVWCNFALVVLALSTAACGLGAAPATPTPVPTATPAPTATPEPEPTPTEDAAYAQAMTYAGHWEGKWQNQTFGSEGDLQLDIEVQPDGTVTFIVDVGGMAFGTIDPDPATYLGTYDAEGIHVLVEGDPLYGRLGVLIAADGTLTAESQDIPVPGIQSMTVEGTLTPTEMQLAYTVQLAAVKATGEVRLTKESYREPPAFFLAGPGRSEFSQNL